MKKIIWLACLLAMAGNAAASVLITEVMYAPTQAPSETDTEWIEIYNNGTEPVDLTNWTVDGYAMDDAIILPGEYMVIARELTDSSDEDLDCFESVWGNNDGVWDEKDGFKAIDGYFTLSTTDTIILTDGINTETMSYNMSYGGYLNGKSIERINLSLPNTPDNWAESKEANGTPGRARQTEQPAGILKVNATINNMPPAITGAKIISDDLPDEGTQILPDFSGTKEVWVTVEAYDANGADDLQSATITIANRTYALAKQSQNLTTAVFNGSFMMSLNDTAGMHEATVSVADSQTTATTTLAFEYMGIISAVLDTAYLSFSELNPGETSDPKPVTIRNMGNVAIDMDLSGAELISGEATLPAGILEIKTGEEWTKLSLTPTPLGINLPPSQTGNFDLRIVVPEIVKPGTYGTALRVISRAA